MQVYLAVEYNKKSMNENLNNLPLYQKALEILKLTEALVTTIPEDDVFLEATKGFMMENAYIIPAKIAGAEGAGLYGLKMENAAIIRKAARELYVQAGSLKHFSDEKHDYPNLLRLGIDEFKALFVQWVKAFDVWDYIVDDWGLFNPPGIEPE